MKPMIVIACATAVLLGCAVVQDDKAAPLRHVKLSQGMARLEAERLIAEATGTTSTYDVHAMDTSTEVRYRDATTVLVVVYKPGFPSPRVQDADGLVHGLPPIDGEVMSWRWETDSAKIRK
jgi:hypothetical protein